MRAACGWHPLVKVFATGLVHRNVAAKAHAGVHGDCSCLRTDRPVECRGTRLAVFYVSTITVQGGTGDAVSIPLPSPDHSGCSRP